MTTSTNVIFKITTITTITSNTKMGTRGLFGFIYRGKYYLIYNHWDSYPQGLGVVLINEIINAIEQEFNGSPNKWFADWTQLLDQIRVIADNDVPTEQDIQALTAFTDLVVSSQSTSDWYCLTRNCQSSFVKTLQSGYLLPYSSGDVDNLDSSVNDFCYSYILDFDRQEFRWFDGEEQDPIPISQISANIEVEPKIFTDDWLNERVNSS